MQQDKSDVTPVEDAAVAIDVDWSPASAVSVQLASHFAVQLGPSTRSLDHPRPDGVYLIVGLVAPPITIGNAEAVKRQLDRLGNTVPVTVHGRYFMTRERLGELIQVLKETADKYDRTVAEAGGA